MARICVVLATYNGEKYLSKMLDSLVAQSRPADVIIAVDDGSKDSTCEILEKYRDTLPLKIEALPQNTGHRAAFSHALTLAQKFITEDDLIALADQDDVWLPQKLEVLEEKIDSTKTSLVFGDAEVIDGDGNKIADSWREFAKIEKHISIEHQIAGINNVTGCMSLFRASLLDAVLPIPEGVSVHDRWIAMIADKNGGIAATDVSVIQYRIHGANAVGGVPDKSMRKTLEERIRWVETLLTHRERLKLTEAEILFANELIDLSRTRLQKPLVLSKLPWIIRHHRKLFLKDSPIKTLKRELFSAVGLPLAHKIFGKD